MSRRRAGDPSYHLLERGAEAAKRKRNALEQAQGTAYVWRVVRARAPRRWRCERYRFGITAATITAPRIAGTAITAARIS